MTNDLAVTTYTAYQVSCMVKRFGITPQEAIRRVKERNSRGGYARLKTLRRRNAGALRGTREKPAAVRDLRSEG